MTTKHLIAIELTDEEVQDLAAWMTGRFAPHFSMSRFIRHLHNALPAEVGQ